jgi:hypothetical protein
MVFAGDTMVGVARGVAATPACARVANLYGWEADSYHHTPEGDYLSIGLLRVPPNDGLPAITLPGSGVIQGDRIVIALMLFSKFPFEPMPASVAPFLENTNNIVAYVNRFEPWTDVASTIFTECATCDCLSNKGAGMVRVRNPHSGRIHNVVLTHSTPRY